MRGSRLTGRHHLSSSEQTVVLDALDLIVIRAEGLVHVSSVGDVLGVLGLIGLSFAVGEDFLACDLITLHHFNGEDVIDLNVMSGDAVVQKVRGEHHVVSLVPELWVVLVIELHNVARANEPETRDDQEGEPEPHEKGRIIEGALGRTDN